MSDSHSTYPDAEVFLTAYTSRANGDGAFMKRILWLHLLFIGVSYRTPRTEACVAPLRVINSSPCLFRPQPYRWPDDDTATVWWTPQDSYITKYVLYEHLWYHSMHLFIKSLTTCRGGCKYKNGFYKISFVNYVLNIACQIALKALAGGPRWTINIGFCYTWSNNTTHDYLNPCFCQVLLCYMASPRTNELKKFVIESFK